MHIMVIIKFRKVFKGACMCLLASFSVEGENGGREQASGRAVSESS